MAEFINNFFFIFNNLPLLLNATLTAIFLTFASIFIGMIVGISITFLRIYSNKFVKKIVFAYEWVLKGTPPLIVIFIFYFGLGKYLNLGPFLSAALALGLRSSAYQSQIYRGAVLSITSEQTEAGLSLGLSRVRTFILIIIPQAFRLSLPGFTNEFTIVLKDTPLAYAVGLVEILKAGRDILNQPLTQSITGGNVTATLNPFAIFLLCALLYFILFEIFSYSLKTLSKKYEIPGFVTDKETT
ncbi:MAG: amino acid ABC transporter permease [Exilispira sp.]